MTSGLTSYFLTREKASAIASMAQPNTKLLVSLIALAASGLNPASNVPLPMASNRGLHFATASAGPAGTIPSWPVAASPAGPGRERLPDLVRLLMDFVEHMDNLDAMGAHDEMNRTSIQRVSYTSVADGDAFQNFVACEHRYDDVAAFASLCDRRRYFGTFFGQGCRSLGYDVISFEFMTRTQDLAAIPLPMRPRQKNRLS